MKILKLTGKRTSALRRSNQFEKYIFKKYAPVWILILNFWSNHIYKDTKPTSAFSKITKLIMFTKDNVTLVGGIIKLWSAWMTLDWIEQRSIVFIVNSFIYVNS